jgi:hypothetical protein
VLSVEDYNTGPDVLASMITSNRRRWDSPEAGDVRLEDWEAEGLLHPSVLRVAKLRDLERFLLEGPIGALSARDQRSVDDSLRKVLGIPR